MTTKHTPGPWKTCLGKIVSDDGTPYGGVTIAHYYNDHVGIRNEAPANAALIAAAPELLEALQTIATCSRYSSEQGDDMVFAMDAIRELARKTIAKAEGVTA